MHIIETLDNNIITSQTAVCFGNFDGLHLGHKFLISELKENAVRLGLQTVLCTFKPHPHVYYEKEIQFLTKQSKRLSLFQAENTDYIVYAPFNKIATLTPEDFFNTVVIDFLKAKLIVVGTDYKFGHKRAGNIDTLKMLGIRYGVDCLFVDKVTLGGSYISSTRIREAILNGNIDNANEMLGRAYSIQGVVINGDGNGKSFGFPTINIDTENDIIPHDGVYATKVKIDDKCYNSMTYIGTRPTVDGKDRRVETNIFDFSENIYNKSIELFFVKRIGNNEKFESINKLIEKLREFEKISRDILQK